MSARSSRPSSEGDARLREPGLQLAMRFVATLRTGRSYAIGNLVFTRQLEQLLAVLTPLLEQHGDVLVVSVDGDLNVNGVRLPLRSSSLRFLEQLAQEFQVREIAGVEFRQGLALAELEGFMRYFLPSELYKGNELHHACATQNFLHVMPVESAVPEAISEAGAPGEPSPEIATAVHAYQRALQNAQVLLADDAWQRGIELRHLKRISQPLVDAVSADGAGTAALAAVPRSDTSGWEHAVRVCVLAVAIGRHLGLDRAALAEVGVAALLHDVGKDSVAGRVRHPLAGRGPAERADAESHTLEGLRHVALSTTLNATSLTAMRAALEHHATVSGDGYPAFTAGWRVSPCSRLVGIADAFISQLEHREPGRAELSPFEALGRVLGPLAPAFPPGLRAALVRALGVYPPGQVLELDDGSIVRALGPGATDPERPLVEPLVTAEGVPVAPGAVPLEVLPPGRSVRRALPISQWPAGGRAA
jgi:HD-GYP domain-containing protein (c-di-GMP phosphodiesterase class II)